MTHQWYQPKKDEGTGSGDWCLPSKVMRFFASAGNTLEAFLKSIEGVLLLAREVRELKDGLLGEEDPTGTIVNKKWEVGSLIDAGGFGAVYRAKDIETHEVVAIKFELSTERSDLNHENKIYIELSRRARMSDRRIVVPRVRHFGTVGDRNVLVMDFLGLHALFQLQALHQIGYIHRDIKPDNFLVGGDDPRRLYLIDFGLAKRYVQPNGESHINYREGVRLVGTPHYVSINTHNGIEQSRRDDLESLGYVLVFLCKGFLPWEHLSSHPKDSCYEELGYMKSSYPLRELCEYIPVQVLEYFRYVRSLKFDENPDYRRLMKLFRKGMRSTELEIVL